MLCFYHGRLLRQKCQRTVIFYYVMKYPRDHKNTENTLKIKWYQSISFKLTFVVGFVVTCIFGFFMYVVMKTSQDSLLRELLRSATQLSETVRRSTHYDMLENRRENIYRIIRTIASQKGIEKIRIFNKEGRIMFSTAEEEAGKMVDKKAEECYACHARERPLERLDIKKRSRIFRWGEDKHRVFGMITPIYNEESCYTAACHYHPPEQKILGVLDIVISLKDVDQRREAMLKRFLITAALAILSTCLLIIVFMQKALITPVRKLVEGTEKIAEGKLEHRIDVDTEDEIGILARSFNVMAENLKKAEEEIQEWIRTLEEKVKRRTRELEATQKQLIQSEKMVSLGKLAATVAHEINNPLTGVLTYLRLISRKLSESEGEMKKEDLLRYLWIIEAEIKRASVIVKELLDFARQREPILKEVDINKVLEGALSILSNEVALRNITVKKYLSRVPIIKADPNQLKQVFINIVMNACEAIKEKGEITITTRYDENAGEVEIQVTDTGIGIPEENLSRIFDPFFTTKEKGTGLGLSVAYNIITNHKGKIQITSKEGEGTTVTIRLPVS